MNISLISHASVVIDAGGVKIWTDPWVVSKAFNNSWALLGKPAYDPGMLSGIQFLWISHEHPDHFNIPTLKSLPADFKSNVTVLFQKKNSEKIFDAMRRFGFTKFRALPNEKIVELTPGVEAYCFQTCLGDSCLGVRHGGETVFNINDAELSPADCNRIIKKVGRIDVVLNQFSLAGYLGYPKYELVLPISAQEKLRRIYSDHKNLHAEVTIPFASFIYFCCDDNRDMNKFGNTPRTVFNYMREHGARTYFLYLGESVSVNEAKNSGATESPGLRKWEEVFEKLDELEYYTDPAVPMEELERLARTFSDSLKAHFPMFLLRRIKPITFFMPDLDQAVVFDICSGTLDKTGQSRLDADIIVNSQPLSNSFKFPFGFETLAVSGRFHVQHNFRNWTRLKIITILWNNEIFLKSWSLIQPRVAGYLIMRVRAGLIRQMWNKAKARRALTALGERELKSL